MAVFADEFDAFCGQARQLREQVRSAHIDVFSEHPGLLSKADEDRIFLAKNSCDDLCEERRFALVRGGREGIERQRQRVLRRAAEMLAHNYSLRERRRVARQLDLLDQLARELESEGEPALLERYRRERDQMVREMRENCAAAMRILEPHLGKPVA